jgi:pilus assembly protein CpaF
MSTPRFLTPVNPLPGGAVPPPAPAAAALSANAVAYQAAVKELWDVVLKEYQPKELRAAGPDAPLRAWVRERAEALVDRLNDAAVKAGGQSSAFDLPTAEIVRQLLDEVFELGPLTGLVRTAGVEDIAINGPADVWYKKDGRWFRSEIRFPDADTLRNLLNNYIAQTGRQVDFTHPIVDATLPSGHRVNVVMAPLADPWPVASIRIKRETALEMRDLVATGGEDQGAPPVHAIPDYFRYDQGRGLFTALSAAFLHMAVNAGFNIVVAGATGAGKTTVLSALGRMIPDDRRILIIEDVAELNVRSRGAIGEANNCVRFLTRAESTEGLAPIGPDALVRAALRQRPDALCVGEARGGEVFDLLKSLRTGHRNGLTSIHADSIEDLPTRIQMMMQEAKLQTRITQEEIAMWIAKAFQLALMLRQTETGRRYVEAIVEFTGGIEGLTPVRTPLFVYDPAARRLRCTGNNLTPQHDLLLQQAGYAPGYAAILDAAREAS